MTPFQPENSAVVVIDVQSALFSQIENASAIERKLLMAVQGFQSMNVPFFVSEQVPEKLGSTLKSLQSVLGDSQTYISKNCFNAADLLPIEKYENWILLGIEAHICVLQTARGLLQCDKNVAIINDATGSRSIFDFSTAIAEMRDMGARITSLETMLFEMIGSSDHEAFPVIRDIVKKRCCRC